MWHSHTSKWVQHHWACLIRPSTCWATHLCWVLTSGTICIWLGVDGEVRGFVELVNAWGSTRITSYSYIGWSSSRVWQAAAIWYEPTFPTLGWIEDSGIGEDHWGDISCAYRPMSCHEKYSVHDTWVNLNESWYSISCSILNSLPSFIGLYLDPITWYFNVPQVFTSIWRGLMCHDEVICLLEGLSVD